MAQADSYRLRYEQWVSCYAPELYRYAYRLCGKKQVAEDLIQETFTEAWRSIAKQKDETKARAWLFQILRFRYSHFVRDGSAQAKTVALPENAGELFRGPAPQPLEALADRDALQMALQTLSPVIRETFLMVFMEGHTCRQTADILKVPIGTVLSRLDQARRSLRTKLTDQVEGHGRGVGTPAATTVTVVSGGTT